MSTTQSSDTFTITESLVSELIAEQFPQWIHLPIKPVEVSGWDNRTFHLGQEMSVRLPSAQEYAVKVAIEQKWLPYLAPHLSFLIPQPIAMGKPSKHYPWQWSIYRWIEGNSANLFADDTLDLTHIAQDLAQFLHELHTINTNGAPPPGPHNFYRGASVKVYDEETRSAFAKLHDAIDTHAAMAVWQKAINSTWHKKPVWFHGDFSAGNILIKDNRLVGVIDFGGMGVGDPACDLVIAWTLLKDESRRIFKELINLDSDTWARARGWALWKALITLAQLQDKNSPEALKQKLIIGELISEHTHKNRD